MRIYYNERIGQPGESPKLDLATVSRHIKAAYLTCARADYLQEAFGYHCVDAGEVPGNAGSDFRTQFYLRTGIEIRERVDKFLDDADEVRLLTFIEFVHDHVSRPDPESGRLHSYMSCGMHYDCDSARFDTDAARTEWRQAVDKVLKYYGDGFSLSDSGEIQRSAPDGFGELLKRDAPQDAGAANLAKLASAVKTFRRGLSTREERKQAIRDLVDLLEFYRAEVKTSLLKKDEADLFDIANNFALRHHRRNQKDDYPDVWLNWLFYMYLSTVHLVLDLVHAQSPQVIAENGEEQDIPF